MDEPKNETAEPVAHSDELDDVIPVYANNVRFEMTAWDLRILFGQLMPISEGKGLVDWHTDVTIPWAQAKLMHLYLGINLTLYERENGKINVPSTVQPAPITTPPEGVDTSNPEAIETFKVVQDMIKIFREAQLSGK
jgi:hypothetical protein